jgi:hypothetical protein
VRCMHQQQRFVGVGKPGTGASGFYNDQLGGRMIDLGTAVRPCFALSKRPLTGGRTDRSGSRAGRRPHDSMRAHPVTQLEHVVFRLPDSQTPPAGPSQSGNLSSRSMAWKRGSLRSGSKRYRGGNVCSGEPRNVMRSTRVYFATSYCTARNGDRS